MSENSEIFRGSIEAALNHLERAEEGRKLLEDNRSLSEMTTPLVGISNEQTIKRRQDFVNWLKELDEDQLFFAFKNTNKMLENRWDDPNKGTSELELRRILFEDEFESRGMEVPELDLQD